MRPDTAGALCVVALPLLLSPYVFCSEFDTEALDSALSIADLTAEDDKLVIILIEFALTHHVMPEVAHSRSRPKYHNTMAL